jgi:DNA ligase D-like protein (predicted ligase)
MARQAIRRRPPGAVTAPDLADEFAHFVACEHCGQNIDRRDLGAVLHHQEPGHDPIPSGLGFIEPMLLTLAEEPPAGDDWQHEIKYDGYRTQILVEAAEVRVFTRNGFDWTDRYPSIIRAAGELRCSSAILDGEAIVQDEQGRSDFAAFQEALASRPEELIFMGFDLLHLNGRDLRAEPLIERRVRLQELVGCHDPGCCIQYSEHVIGNGAGLFEAADRMGLEGIVSKKLSSRYRSGRARSWLKVKCFAEEEFVVIGTERAAGKPATALLAREGEGGLEYAGGAMVTLPEAERDRFWRAVEQLKAPTPPVPLPTSKAMWMEPRLRVRTRFLKGGGKLRHATLKALVGG